MQEIISTIKSLAIDLIIPIFGACIVAAIYFVIAALKSRTKSKELEAKKIELEIKNTELATEKAILEQKIIEGSFVICPNCGHEIGLSSVEIKIRR